MPTNNTQQSKAETFGLSFLMLGLVCAFLAGHFAWHQFAIAPEPALRLSEAQLMAGGAVPYVDFYDTATPFYLYLNLLPAWLSRASSLHPILLFNELNVLLLSICGSTLIMLGQLHTGPGPRAGGQSTAFGHSTTFGHRRNLLTGCFVPFFFAYLLIVVLRIADFGHTNQLLFVGATPYIVCRVLQRRGLKVPRLLSFIIALMFSLAILTDLLYLFGFVLFEAINLLSFAPYPRGRFLARRYFTDSFILAMALTVSALFGWWVLPPCGQTQYLSDMVPLYLAGFAEVFGPLRYAGNGSDLRPDIFIATFLLVLSAPLSARNILSRYFAVASLLAFALMIAWSACFYYQSFCLIAFALLAFIASMRKWPSRLAVRFPVPSTLSSKIRLLPLMIVLCTLAASAVFLTERSLTDKNHLYDLAKLGYWGHADSHDLGPMSEAIEAATKPKESVAVVSLGVRPAYPALTQLRRLPGLSLTWGFPIMTLNMLDSPAHQDETLKFAPLKKKIFSQMASQLAPGARAPKMVAIEEGETQLFLEQTGVLKTLKRFYTETSTVPLFDLSESNEHQLKEFVGYKNCVSVFVRKN